ncbi:MAG: HAD family phosphatase [Elusimicrobia bacterium]|nr:HAD family phosphatase [Elusimicrobiota bacterium]
MAPPLKAVLFDNDGVLADTEDLYFDSCRTAVRERGFDLTLADYQEVSLRQGASTIDFAAQGALAPYELLAVKKRRDDIYLKLLESRAEARAGVKEVLEALSGRATLAVVTAAHRVHFDAVHRRTGFAPYFSFVLTQEDCPVSKPDPAPYLMALERGGWRPSECIVVEDTERGLAAATAAGIPCLVTPCGPSVGGSFAGAAGVYEDMGRLKDALLARL